MMPQSALQCEDATTAGIDRDNIYTTKAGTIVDSQTDATDAILLPTAE
jgi:hypothetical protein